MYDTTELAIYNAFFISFRAGQADSRCPFRSINVELCWRNVPISGQEFIDGRMCKGVFLLKN